MKTQLVPLFAIAAFAGCAGITAAADDDSDLIDNFDPKADASHGPRSMNCWTVDGIRVKVRFTPNGDAFDIEATRDDGLVFALAMQRPSLNVEVEDGAGTIPREFLDFRASGLEVVPVLALPRLELTMATGPKRLVYADMSAQTELSCIVSAPNMLAFLAMTPVREIDATGVTAVGFDIDDTLLFSTPTFARGFATGGLPKPDDVVFWTATNGCDGGCSEVQLTLPDGTTRTLPANAASTVKAQALELVDYHRSLGQEVYAITARPDINGDPLRAYLEAELGIDRDHVFFEPDIDQPGNPAGKTDRIASLALGVFYGDADSDITDARKANVRAVRFQRSPRSSNRKDGRLNKYHPGYYGEPIVASSYD
jgi:acid phosphatase (class B)